jgi:hypothetical protein
LTRVDALAEWPYRSVLRQPIVIANRHALRPQDRPLRRAQNRTALVELSVYLEPVSLRDWLRTDCHVFVTRRAGVSSA